MIELADRDAAVIEAVENLHKGLHNQYHYPFSALSRYLKENPLGGLFDPNDDLSDEETALNFISKVFIIDSHEYTRATYFLYVEYDSRIDAEFKLAE